MPKKLIVSLFLFTVLLGWSTNPAVNTPINTESGNQIMVFIETDGSRGCIIVWRDDNYSFYAQRLDSNGNELWQSGGVKILDKDEGPVQPAFVSDESGGLYVVGSNIRAQHINSAGKPSWGKNGIAITDRAPVWDLVATGDGKGNLIVVQLDDGPCAIYSDSVGFIQKINKQGKSLWFRIMHDCLYDTFNPVLTKDSKGNVISAWEDAWWLDLSALLYVQKWDADGNKMWKDNLSICPSGGKQHLNSIFPDGHDGAVIIFERDSIRYMQRINASGNLLWGNSGIVLDNSWESINVIPGANNAMLLIFRSGNEIYANCVDTSGSFLWGDPGKKVADTNDGGPSAIIDGYNGAIFSWISNGKIYAQRINSSGKILWNQKGVIITSTNGNPDTIGLTKDGSHGAIISWSDDRNGKDYDLFAQKICSNGRLGYCDDQLVAVIDASRSGGLVPASINFDGRRSTSPNSTIVSYKWDFDDGIINESTDSAVDHIFSTPGRYIVKLTIKDNLGREATAERTVILYSHENITASISLDPSKIKANSRGQTNVQAVCFETGNGTGRMQLEDQNIIEIKMDLTFTASSGTFIGEVTENDGLYSQTLLSDDPGIATISAYVDNYLLGSTQVEYSWPRPPVNLNVKMNVNRGLFGGEYFATISWSSNPAEIYSPASYKIYRSTNEGAMILVGTVNATQFSYIDEHLPAGNRYSYSISMVDSEGDESDLSSPITIRLKQSHSN